MAAGSLLALLDDITSVLDDVAVLTKVAAKKTSGVLGDDLALNAEQVSGLNANRELPVVFAVAKGSLVNKAILVPAALAISAFTPWAVTPLLMVGGGFLCFEGVEKVLHKLLHKQEEAAEHAEHVSLVADPAVDLVALEKEKVRGAIRTDFVLSAEIVTIALGTVAEEPFMTRFAVLSGLSLLMTVGVYGLVAGVVKIDDAGLALSRTGSSLARGLGRGLLAFAPLLMRGLTIAGTAAMFLVGGGIMTHGTPGAHDFIHHQTEAIATAVGAPSSAWVFSSLADALYGAITGAVILAVVSLIKRVRKPAAA